MFFILLLTVAFAVSAAWILQYKNSRLPPGPPRGLLGDNRHQVPASEPYKKFAEWANEYGPIISFRLGRTPVVVLSKAKAAWDLLDKRGDIYSSRPRSIMGQEILADNMRGLSMAYGEKWRRWRKIQHSGLNEKFSMGYREFQTLESAVLLHDILQDANGHTVHFQRFATSVVFSISYGNRISRMDEQVVKDNQEAGIAFGRTHIPGRFLVESWPVLLWLPKPLQWFRWEQDKRRLLDIKLYVGCFREVKRRMDAGIAKPSMSMKMWEDGPLTEKSEIEMAYAAASPFTAGIGTVSSALDIFLVAMLLHPECTRKAQEELDAVVGSSRMPIFDDEESLPYLRALIKETMRWRVVTPSAMSHATTADDVYEGYHIPKGATVIANVYMISMDPDIFPEPEKFMPERFLETTDPRLMDFDLPYGFGRRICPGRYVANQSLFIVIARMLWAFDFAPFLDANGKAVLPDPDAFTSNLTRRPNPFKCRLTPRSADIEKIILTDKAQSQITLREWE